jgi:hypothetical protein
VSSDSGVFYFMRDIVESSIASIAFEGGGAALPCLHHQEEHAEQKRYPFLRMSYVGQGITRTH